MFSKQIFFLIFHDGPQGWKHDKFKSKKQKFSDFNFFVHETFYNNSRGIQKIWTHFWSRNRRFFLSKKLYFWAIF